VILSPAAADIFQRLGASDVVVGVTRNVEVFPGARKVGSHIHPNMEIIASLHPDLVVISSNRFFSQEMARRVGARVFQYNPATCQEILDEILRLGSLLGKEGRARALVSELEAKLSMVKPLGHRPTVVYEVMAHPYMVAGKKNIVADIVEKAGGRYLIGIKRKLVPFSYEKVVALAPQVYIWQVGPMNRNPLPPKRRAYLKTLKAHFVRVKELAFARPNTHAFDNVLWLNRLFLKLKEQ